ncbi:CYTH-like domain-containing protein [Catenaria anguillulae PL171]|uniref:mRNA-capping enzyme subunit beta n=1 Tax=Catenaria anguillulae PL171 TaxID=765915 RepID=A0A1Y2HTP1_9FUNG|nr:CYTH-like domain-containing protein [Catenaria anguillulae PL171]
MEPSTSSTQGTGPAPSDPLPQPPSLASATAAVTDNDHEPASSRPPKRTRAPSPSEDNEDVNNSEGHGGSGRPASKRQHIELSSTSTSARPASGPASASYAPSASPSPAHSHSGQYPPTSSLSLVPAPLPPTIFGAPVTPDIHLAVCNFIHGTISRYQSVLASRPNAIVEVEAKLGRLVDARGGPPGAGDQRIYLPVTCETELVSNQIPTRFVSNMDMGLHRHFNRMLNELVMQDKRACKYTHTILVDRSYSLAGDKYRETRDKKSGAVVDRTRKTKLAHLDIYVPNAPLDYRVSVAIEEPWTELPAAARLDANERVKDRISYAHALVQVDLTMVHSVPVGQQPSAGKPPSYELEVEFVDAGASVLREKAKMDRGEPNRLKENIVHLVNNIRYLAGRGAVPSPGGDGLRR